VQANSSRFKLARFDPVQNELMVKVCLPALKGKANKELLKELKKVFNSSAEIIKGEKSNKKKVLVHARSEQVLAAIAPKISEP